MSTLTLTLTMRDRPRSPLDLSGLLFDLVLTNSAAEEIEFETPRGWDLDVPGSLDHSSDSQGELWIRALGRPDPGHQRYSCTDAEPSEDLLRLGPGERFLTSVGAPKLPPGDYEARVKLYRPQLCSEVIEFRVGQPPAGC